MKKILMLLALMTPLAGSAGTDVNKELRLVNMNNIILTEPEAQPQRIGFRGSDKCKYYGETKTKKAISRGISITKKVCSDRNGFEYAQDLKKIALMVELKLPIPSDAIIPAGNIWILK
ncbi:hypothetical protein ABW286_21895 [Erwinia papayae]|uniref:Uncharacterized protein n=1 Tax=Erwinia papayae TaxID=206499 RepID=A0ABV3N7I7_9GAMM